MTAGDWTIRPYRPGDEGRILELFNEIFRPYNPDYVDRTLDHWRWLYAECGHEHQTWVVETPQNRLIGQYTAIPMMLNIRGERSLVGQAVDTCVHPDYRRSLRREGVFLSLARAWFDHWGRDERDRIVYGFPNEQAYPIGTRMLHYRPVHCPVMQLDREVGDRDAPAGAGLEIELRESFSLDVGELYERLRDGLGLSTWRDRAYLDWRFVRCPSATYRIVEARRAGALAGYAVFRLGWFAEKLAPIVDLLCDPADAEVLPALVGAVAREARVAGMETMRTWMPPGFSQHDALIAAGFRVVPSFFSLCIRIFNPMIDLEYAKQRWYYTMADSDIY